MTGCFSRTPEFDALYEKVSDLESIEREFYVDSIETDDHPSHSHSWCWDHARMVAKVESILVGAPMLVAAGGSASDRAPRCEWHGCDIALRAELTDYGIDDALAMTEERPLECGAMPASLVLVADSLVSKDPRWKIWHWHAAVLVGDPTPSVETHDSCGGVVLLRRGEFWCSRCRRRVEIGA